MVEAIEIKPNIGEFDLPRGYIDENNNIYRRVLLRELTGEEEDILASNTMNLFTKLNKVLANCILGFIKSDGNLMEINDKNKLFKIVREMCVTDRLFLFLSLRILSVGNIYSFNIVCPTCGENKSYAVDLSTLEIKKPKELCQTYELELPSGIKVRMKVMTGVEEEMIALDKKSVNDSLTYAIFVRMLELNGHPVNIDIVKKLPLKDRNYIRTMIAEYEGSIDTVLEIRCTHCLNEFNSLLDLGKPSFFFPSET